MNDSDPYTLPENALAPTPGRWLIKGNDLTGTVVLGGNETMYPVATASGNPLSSDAERAAEAASNARLIAAAPKLLAAAKKLVEALDDLIHTGPMTNGKVSQARGILAGTIVLLENGPWYYDD